MGQKKRKALKKVEKELLDKGIEVISLAKSQAPVVSERIQRTKDWVFFGEDNLFPSKLIRLADNSALHSSVLDIKSKMIAGNGFVFSGDDAEQAEQFLTEATGDDVTTYLNRVSTDMSYFDSFYLNVQFNKDGKIGTTRHLDYSFMRSGKMDLDKRAVESFWMSTRWDIATKKMVYAQDELIYKPIQILAFDPSLMRDSLSKKNGQIIVSKKYSPGKLFYSDPSYLGAINYIDIAGKIANFHKSQLENGMVGNMHVHIPKDLRDDTLRLKTLQALNDQYAGSDNAGRIFLTWGTGAGGKVEVTPIPDSGAHQSLALLNEKVNQEIITAHAIPKQMVGVDVKAGLGGLQFREAVEMFQNISIAPKQKQISDTFNGILRFNDIDAEVAIDPIQPATFLLSDEIFKLTTTFNEAREIAKFPLTEDEELGNTLLIDLENGNSSTEQPEGREGQD